ncbi:MAG TPA: class I SAM-dependent methyltransferase [Methylomirabilota bacterium]|nr:class I SAM-dependent methyltransferase [Methylomirabilota bacterium]
MTSTLRAPIAWLRRVWSKTETEPVTVDSYWSRHTVNSKPFASAEESERYLEWRFEQYPLFREFMSLWGTHDGEVILDYGCGPGDDVTGLLLYTRAKRVIGMDVSPKALGLTRGRLALHGVHPARFQLVQTSDSSVGLPFEAESFDYINCGGVLHHTSRPDEILREFHRVLKPGRPARIMVYNRNSLWFHLYTAYGRMLVENAFRGLSVDEAFARNTDGERCPIARAYAPDHFLGLLEKAGFSAEFVGGYLSLHELACWTAYGTRAVGDRRLGEEHRQFLNSLDFDASGYPRHAGKHAGIGGVYVARRS